MDEEKKAEEPTEKPEEKKPKTAEAGDVPGSEPKTTTLIDDANTAAERLEKANERQAELLRQQQELEAKRALGGRSAAGQQPPEPVKETDAEYADKVMKGEANPLKDDGFIS